jgi:hypothetical protein
MECSLIQDRSSISEQVIDAALAPGIRRKISRMNTPAPSIAQGKLNLRFDCSYPRWLQTGEMLLLD